RIDWNDKVSNILSIVEELGYGIESFVFIDDNPVERQLVRRRLPEVLVLGENLFELRRPLLADPRLQTAWMTKESMDRTQLVAAQLRRTELRRRLADDQLFRESLNLVCDIRRLTPQDEVERIRELFERTTQFNTSGRKFTAKELALILQNKND